MQHYSECAADATKFFDGFVERCETSIRALHQPLPFTLDQKIAALSPEIDDELRVGLKARCRALRRGDPDEHIVTLLIMARWTLRLLDKLFATVGKQRPSDNPYHCIITAANGDGKKVAGLKILPAPIASYLHTIRILSNKADHAKDLVDISDSGKSAIDYAEEIDLTAPDFPVAITCDTIRLTPQDAENAISAFLRVLEWLYCEYEKGPRLATIWTNSFPDFPDDPSPFSVPTIVMRGPGSLQQEKAPFFVARHREMGTLFSQSEVLARHQGVSGLLVGEGGTGKSTLVNEFARRFSEKYPQAILSVAGCDIASGQGSYAPFKAVMQQILLCNRILRTDGRAVRPADLVTEVIASLGNRDVGPFAAFTGVATELLQCKLHARPTSSPAAHVTAALDQAAVMDWYSQAIRSVACYFPLVIVLDDIHWADESSLLMFLHLGRVIANWPVLLIGTYRPEEIHPNNLLADVRNQLLRLGAFTITLPTSQTKEDPHYREVYHFCQDYMVAKYGRIFSQDLLDTLVRLSEGNALFLSETLINLEENRYIAYRDNCWKFEGSIDDLGQLPTRIEAVISERLNRLDYELQNLVKLASVEGETFTAEIIASLQGQQERAVLHKIVEQLIRRHQIVHEAGTKRLPNGVRLHLFRFNHIFTKRYIYDYLLTSTEREMFHEDVANCLESLWDQNIAEVAPQLAAHYSLAGVHEKTAVYALRAAKTFFLEYGWSEVTRYARMGIEALESLMSSTASSVPSEIVELYLLYAKGELEGGVRRENIDHIQAGITCLQTNLSALDNLNPLLAADVYLTLGKLYAAKRNIDREKVNNYLHRALQVYENLDDKRGIISALSPHEFDSNLANQLHRTEQLADRQRCLKLAEELNDPIVLANSLNNLAEYYVNFDTDDTAPLARAEEYARRSLEIVKTTRNPIVELHSLLMLSWVHHCCGYYGAELEDLRHKVLALARQHGQTVMEAEALTDVGHYYSLLLDHQEQAAHFMRQAYEYRHRIGRHTVNDCEQYGTLLFRQGRFSKSIALFKESLTTHQDICRETRTRSEIAWIYLLTSKYEEAASEMAQIEASMNTEPSLYQCINSKLMLAYAFLGQREKAQHEANKISAMIDSLGKRGVFHIFTDFPTEMAETHRLLSNLEEAEHWMSVAAQFWDKLTKVTDTHQIIAFWEHEYIRGRILAERGEHERALSLFRNVQAAFEKVHHYLQAELSLELGRSLCQKGLSDQGALALHRAIELAQQFRLKRVAAHAGHVIKGRQE